MNMFGKGTEHAVVKCNLLGGQCSFCEYSAKCRTRGTDQIALPVLSNSHFILSEHLYNIAHCRMTRYCFVNGEEVYIFSLNYFLIRY